MQVEEGLDTGRCLRCEVVPIGETTTADELRRELVDVGTRLLVDELRAGLGDAAMPQVGRADVRGQDRVPTELQIDWTRPPTEIDRLVRLGGAWTTLHGRRLKVVAAELIDPAARPTATCYDGDRVGGLRLLTVQPEGKPPMPFDAFARGARLGEAEPLGQSHERRPTARAARLPLPAADRPRRCVRQPVAAERARPTRGSANATVASSPSWSTARRACGGPAMR